MGENTPAQNPSVGPKAPIRMAATMTMVTLPSMTGARPMWKPPAMAPSRLLPLPSSSRMRSAMMTLASTPMPMPRMMPAMPGSVSVVPGNTAKQPETTASVAVT